MLLALGLALFIVAAAAYVVHGALEKRKNNRRAATRKKELDKFYTSPLQPLEKVDIVPDEGETFYYAGYAEWERRADGAPPQTLPSVPGMLYLSDRHLCFVSALGGEERIVFGVWASAKMRPSAIELRFADGITVFVHSEDIMLQPIFGRLSKKQFAALHS